MEQLGHLLVDHDVARPVDWVLVVERLLEEVKLRLIGHHSLRVQSGLANEFALSFALEAHISVIAFRNEHDVILKLIHHSSVCELNTSELTEVNIAEVPLHRSNQSHLVACCCVCNPY